jgi:AcrR family transcriptional regulator
MGSENQGDGVSLEGLSAPAAETEAVPRRDPARTRTRLLEAGIAEFSEQGFHGARTDRIARRAGSNIRMLYHYFGSKDDLYIAVLEVVLSALRHDELRIDPESGEPFDALLHVFDYVEQHFGQHPELRKLLAFENLNEARHLARSQTVLTTASPVLGLICRLLARGVEAGTVRTGVDPLHLYVAMVSLAYYARAHAFTLSNIFGQDLQKPAWQTSHLKMTREMVASYLRP